MEADTFGFAVLSREPILEQRVLTLPDDPRDGQRPEQCVQLPRELGGGWLVNLHLTHVPGRPALLHAQLWHLVNELSAWAADGRWLLFGDFNAGLAEPEIAVCFWPNGPLNDVFSGVYKLTHVDAQGRRVNLDQIFWRAPPGHALAVLRAWVALDQPGENGVTMCSNIV